MIITNECNSVTFLKLIQRITDDLYKINVVQTK